MTIRHKALIRLFEQVAVLSHANPGVAYVEFNLCNRFRARIDFSTIQVNRVRATVTAQGNEAGAGKGIEIYNNTGAAQLCEVTWAGVDPQFSLPGNWVASTINADSELWIRVKGSSATEDIDLFMVSLELEYS